MTEPTYKERHVLAMLDPQGADETLLVEMFTVLTRLADRWPNDTVMLPAVEHMGSALIAMANAPTGRIEFSALDKQVRDVVSRAGGNADDL